MINTIRNIFLIFSLYFLTSCQPVANENTTQADKDSLSKILSDVYNSDQIYRSQIDSLLQLYGSQSDDMKEHWKKIHHTDSVNLIYVTNILDRHGWMGSYEIGNEANDALFLVIQHADLETQLKYLPMLRIAVKNGNAKSSQLALLEDRTALRQGRKQIYGSQVSTDNVTGQPYFEAMIDPDRVDERRDSAGLQPIAEYARHFGINWNLDEYKRKLPELEEKLKNSGW